MKISGVDRVRRSLEMAKRRYGADKTPSVIVGYTAEYALYVHEDLEARHDTAHNQQAKYLERPAREKRGELRRVFRAAMRAGASMLESLFAAGLRLQRESQEICPVSGWDPVISPPRQGSGNLKGSAFTRKE